MVLGIVDGLHDAGAALVIDGQLVAAVNEERFTRRKLQGGMPIRSIAAVLGQARVHARDVDALAVGGIATPTVATRLVRPLQRLLAPSLGICFTRPWHPVDRLGDLVRYRFGLTRAKANSWWGQKEGHLARTALRRQLPPRLRRHPLHFVAHHEAHADSAWRSAGAGTWLVVTADAHGDGCSLTVSEGRSDEARLRLLHAEGPGTSLGAYYSYVTTHLGFAPGRHEGKVLGLSASGDATAVSTRLPFPFEAEEGVLRYTGRWGLRGMADLDCLAGLRREDVAAWLQAGTQRVLAACIAWWERARGATRLAVAGGVFANVALNGHLAQWPALSELWVFPHMGDGGLAAGAALPRRAGPPV